MNLFYVQVNIPLLPESKFEVFDERKITHIICTGCDFEHVKLYIEVENVLNADSYTF